MEIKTSDRKRMQSIAAVKDGEYGFLWKLRLSRTELAGGGRRTRTEDTEGTEDFRMG
jgi:hypothetical protein